MKVLTLGVILTLLVASPLLGQPAPGGKWVTGYYPIWSYCSMSPSDLDFSALTHVILFTADPDTMVYPYFSPVTRADDSSSIEWGVPNPNCSPQGKWGKPTGYSYIRWLNDSAHAHGAKVILCLGGIYGAGRDKMAWIAKDSAKTQAWAEAAVAYVKRKGMDGVDLDWEYPSGSTSGYMRMLRILRRQLDTMNPPGVLAIAAPAWTNNSAYDFAAIGTIVDQINIMSYDFSGGSSAWFNSGLGNNSVEYPAVGATSSPSSWWNWNNHGAKQWLQKGVPASRLAMGIPFYSWRFSGPTGLTQPISGRWYGTYSEAIGKITTFGAGIYHWDDSAKAPYLTYNEGGTNYFITYDDTNSVKYKAQWCNDNGLGGVMIYELVAGWVSSAPAGRKDPLLQAVKQAMGGTIIQPPPLPPAAPVLGAPANAAADQPTSLTLSWAASAGATSYRVQVASTSTFAATASDQTNLSATSANVAGLANGTTYYWRVSAANAGGTSGWSSVRTFTTVAAVQPPTAPVLSVPADGVLDVPTSVILGWNAASGASTYRVQASLSPAFDSFVADQAGIAGTTYTLSGLSNSAVYFWRVSAANTAGAGAWSSVNSFTTADLSQPPPPAPGDTIPAPALLRDDFNRPDGPLPGANRWAAIANFPGGGSLAVASNALQAPGALGVNAAAGAAWDSAMTGGAEASVTLSQKSGSTALPSLSFYARLTGKDYATASGYRMDFREQAGSDIIEIRRVANGLANSILLASTAYELNAGDVITFRVLSDNKTMIALVNGIALVRVADSTVAAPAWYFAFQSPVTSVPSRFDDFRVSPAPPAVMSVAASPSALNFGKVGIGQSKRDSIAVANNGTVEVTVSQALSTAPQFAVTAPAGTVPPGASRMIYVDFQPDNRTAYSGKIAIVVNAGSVSETTYVSGKGVSPPRLRHATAQVNFGAISPEVMKTDSLVVYNDGELDLRITDIQSTNAVFSITPTAATIAPADSMLFLVSAQPTADRAEDGYFIFSYNGNPATDTVGVHLDKAVFNAPPPGIAMTYALGQNYPNPFNPSTTISFTLAAPSVVTLRVYDALGREIATLLDGEIIDKGARALRFDAAGLPSGMYFYRLSAAGVDAQGARLEGERFTSMRKMALVK